VKSAINPYVASGEVAPLYLFYNGPGASTFSSARFTYYGVTGTPTVKFDGTTAGYNPTTYATSIANRLAVPSYVDIDVNMVGDATGGTAYVSVTAEQDLGVSGQIKVWTVICEDHEMATSAWGGYNGQEMMWIPVSFPLTAQGNVISFTGPYPQTVSVAGSYTLNPATHIFDNLNVVTFVQATSTREVFNASYMDLPDTATGIEDESGLGTTDLAVWPNPSNGALSIGAALPESMTGTVTVFSIAGRTITRFDASPVTPISIDEPGIYFVRMETSDGQVLSERFTVVR